MLKPFNYALRTLYIPVYHSPNSMYVIHHND